MGVQYFTIDATLYVSVDSSYPDPKSKVVEQQVMDTLRDRVMVKLDGPDARLNVGKFKDHFLCVDDVEFAEIVNDDDDGFDYPDDEDDDDPDDEDDDEDDDEPAMAVPIFGSPQEVKADGGNFWATRPLRGA